jgi:hypothetical protein
MIPLRRWIWLALPLILGCATARELAALRQVHFTYDHISSPRVAGIPLERITDTDDLSAADLARVGLAVAARDVPLELTVHLAARNPEENNVTARLLQMDWTYLVDDRKVVEGTLAREQALTFPPGETRDVPLGVAFNLVEAFGGSSEDLLDVALVLSGQKVSSRKRTLQIVPTIETSAGNIRYPGPINLDLSAASNR